MDPIKSVQKDLREAGFSPNRLRGQNFLIAESVREQILAAAQIQQGDCILEIGSGTGILTWAMVQNGADIIALEIEPVMASICRHRFTEHVRIVEMDGVAWPELLRSNQLHSSFKCISNLPYGIASPVIIALARNAIHLDCAVIMVQKEVAQRVTANPGTRNRGLISVMTQAFLKAEYLFSVPPGKFWPPPSVESAVIRLTPIMSPPTVQWSILHSFCKVLFATKRKTVVNNLKTAFPVSLIKETLTQMEITHTARPETLKTSTVVNLVTCLHRAMNGNIVT